MPTPSRPLSWRPWRYLTPAEQARMRSLYIEELRAIDAHYATEQDWWHHSHRCLLSLKMCAGREEAPHAHA